ncbi:MAG: hypothetical protein ACPGWR_21320 [Ardenticatenaceae bacterium]
MIKYKESITFYSIEEYFIEKLTTNKWLASILEQPAHSSDHDPLFSDRHDENRFYFQDDPFGDYEGTHLIDLHPTADAEIETKHSTLIVSCFTHHHYISLSVESKEFFFKSFEVRIYYDDFIQLQNALSLLIEYQDVISTENYLGFIARLLDSNLKVFWQSGLVLGEEVTSRNLLNGHPVMEMNW